MDNFCRRSADRGRRRRRAPVGVGAPLSASARPCRRRRAPVGVGASPPSAPTQAPVGADASPCRRRHELLSLIFCMQRDAAESPLSAPTRALVDADTSHCHWSFVSRETPPRVPVSAPTRALCLSVCLSVCLLNKIIKNIKYKHKRGVNALSRFCFSLNTLDDFEWTL